MPKQPQTSDRRPGDQLPITGNPEYDAALAEIAALHRKKAADYGGVADIFANYAASEDYGVPAWLGALLRLVEKLVRIQTFLRKGTLENESMDDAVRDIANLAVIILALYRRAHTDDALTHQAPTTHGDARCK